jgi:hypothetical protein
LSDCQFLYVNCHVTCRPRILADFPSFFKPYQLYRPASALYSARLRSRDVYPRPTRAISPIWTSAALLRSQIRPSRFLDISTVLPPKPPPLPTMTSTASSLFSSVPPTSRFNVPSEIQRPRDLESTHTESLFVEDEPTEPGLDLARLDGYTLPRDKKKLKS